MDHDGTSTDTGQKGYRFFKIQSTGANSSGGSELAIGGLEFYGTVCATHESVSVSLLIFQWYCVVFLVTR